MCVPGPPRSAGVCGGCGSFSAHKSGASVPRLRSCACPPGVDLEPRTSLLSAWEGLRPAFLMTPWSSLFPGNYAVELVNDSLYDWNVKLLK